MSENIVIIHLNKMEFNFIAYGTLVIDLEESEDDLEESWGGDKLGISVTQKFRDAEEKNVSSVELTEEELIWLIDLMVDMAISLWITDEINEELIKRELKYVNGILRKNDYRELDADLIMQYCKHEEDFGYVEFVKKEIPYSQKKMLEFYNGLPEDEKLFLDELREKIPKK